MISTKILFKTLLILLSLLMVSPIVLANDNLDNNPGRVIRVGVWSNPPILMQNTDGQWEGISIDILKAIAANYGWQLEYIQAPFPKQLDNLKKHKIDILAAIAYSVERAKYYSYTRESIISNWAVIFTKPSTNIHSLLDLNNKTVAVMRNNIHYTALSRLAENFQFNIHFLEKNSFDAVMKSVNSGEADAGVVNRLFGALHADEYNLVETGIVFNPIDIHYASPINTNLSLLQSIDHELEALKGDSQSVYYSSIRHWLNPETKLIIPNWIYTSIAIVSGMLLILIFLTWVLRKQVASKTRELQTEIEERRLAQQRLDQLAYYDELTGLPNRIAFYENLKKILARTKRKNQICAILFIDLDKFKDTNDSLGHDAGDKLIAKVAERLKSTLRAEDYIHRFGGDEFVVILSEINNFDEIPYLTNRLINCLRKPIDIGISEIHSTASIGISTCPNDASSIDKLLQFSDAAMYHAKSQGGDTFEFYNKQLTKNLSRRLSLETKLRNALDTEKLSINYQPIYDLNSSSIVGVEALMRWNDVDEGFIAPDTFIPLAEDTGLIIPMGAWILHHACMQIMEWKKAGLANLMLSINVSGRQFVHEDFFQQVIATVQETGISSHKLELEVTERLFLNINDKIRNMLDRIKNTGIRFSIDDFGTGYSSLNYLKKLPIDTLKIDKSFVQNIPQDLDDIRISSAIISIAQSLDLDVIAEGIETHEQLKHLLSQGCSMGQGYFLSRPLEPDNLKQLLLENKATQG